MFVIFINDVMGIKESFMTEIDSIPYNHRETFQDIQAGLTVFGLTPNQSKVYLHLAKHGKRTAPQVSKSLKIPRTETYHLLKKLQNSGIVSATLGHPTKFESMDFEEALVVLLNSEKERIEEMKKKIKELTDKWKSIPEFSTPAEDKKDNKFQVIQGKVPILNKFKHLLEMSSESIIMLGTEEDYLKLYHTDFPAYLKKTNGFIKILTTGTKGADFVFEGVPDEQIKQFIPDKQEDLCFIINDDKEGLFFIKNQDQTKDFVAVWTDSNTLISSLRMLFDLIWTRAHVLHNKNKPQVEMKSDFQHGIREIEQEKKILEFLYKKYPDLSPND